MKRMTEISWNDIYKEWETYANHFGLTTSLLSGTQTIPVRSSNMVKTSHTIATEVICVLSFVGKS